MKRIILTLFFCLFILMAQTQDNSNAEAGLMPQEELAKLKEEAEKKEAIRLEKLSKKDAKAARKAAKKSKKVAQAVQRAEQEKILDQVRREKEGYDPFNDPFKELEGEEEEETLDSDEDIVGEREMEQLSAEEIAIQNEAAEKERKRIEAEEEKQV